VRDTRSKLTDIDLYVTAAAAPAVRSHLVAQGLMLRGLPDSVMSGYGDVPVHGNLQSDVHHVESWGNLGETAKAYAEAYGDEDYMYEDDEGNHVDDAEGYIAADFVSVSLDYGQQLQTHPEHFLKCFYRSQGQRHREDQYAYIRSSHEHAITVLPQENGDCGRFPFNYDDCHAGGAASIIADLVIAESGCTDARKLLCSTDLSICGASWDGRTFRIPTPHLSFKSMAEIEPHRAQIMTKYIQALKQAVGPTDFEDAERMMKLAADAVAIQVVVGSGMLEAAEIRSRDRPEEYLPMGAPTELADSEFGTESLRQHLKAVSRLFVRQKKYAGRGIDIINAPAGVLHVAEHFHEYLSYGGGTWWCHAFLELSEQREKAAK
jgi:hypothetical protein